MVTETQDVVSEDTGREPAAGTEATPAAARVGSGPKKRGGGPKTEEGKKKARMNALKEGGQSKVVFTDEMKADIAKYQKIFTEEFRPRTPYEILLIYDMSVARAKQDHYEQLVLDDIDRVVERVLDYWEEDRRSWALNLAARLTADPSRVAHSLAQKKQGAELMIGLWEGLAKALETQPDWDEDQRRLANDLLGVRPELRSGNATLPPAGDTAALAALAAGEIERLKKDVEERLAAADESAQWYTLAGIPVERDAITKSLQQYLKRFQNDYQRALAELRRVRGTAGTGPAPRSTSRPYRSPNGVPPAEVCTGATTGAGASEQSEGDSGSAALNVRVEERQASEEGPAAGAELSEAVRASGGSHGNLSEAPRPAVMPVRAAAGPSASVVVQDVGVVRSTCFMAAQPADQPLGRRARKAREKRLRDAMKKERRKQSCASR